MDAKYVGKILAAVCMLGAGFTTRGASQAVAVGVRSEAVRPTIVTIDAVDAPLIGVLQSIARQSGLHVFGNEKILTSQAPVTVHLHRVTAEEAFAKALSGTGLKAEIVASVVTFAKDETMGSVVQGGITGKVVDAQTGQGIPGATVIVDHETKGVISGGDGTFRIASIAPGQHTLHVKMLGYVKATKMVTVVEGQTASVGVALAPSVNALDQVVVTGTVAATAQREVPNAMTVITAKQLEERGITHIDQLFRGDVPGIFAGNSGSYAAIDEVNTFSRGVTSLRPNTGSKTTYYTNPIKTYLDGVELSNPAYLNQIDPKSIERIEILTGPQASTIYGSNAINGVMQIFTKRGTSSRPELTLSLSTGFVENDFSPALTPQHDDALSLTGIEGRWSYHLGASWSHIGAWTPAKKTTRTAGYGGARLALGLLSGDGSLRLGTMQNQQHGETAQVQSARSGTGAYAYARSGGVPTTATWNGQTLGLTLVYTVTPWWTHTFTAGRDVSSTETATTERGFRFVSDSALQLQESQTSRTSLSYTTTARAALTPAIHLTVTGGADGWQSLTSTRRFSSLPALTGSLGGSSSITRQPSHNAGLFGQGQLGVADAVFFTYGLRGEWNPNYGRDARPNLAPRYGLSYVFDMATPVGLITTKLRGGYGRSTRPPEVNQTRATLSGSYLDPFYPKFEYIRANPALEPEVQQGGEGGIEVYLAQYGSLVVTRFNQTVDQLIALPFVDSVKSLVPYPDYYRGSLDADGYGYTGQYQYANVGSVRNQGWEVQGTLNVGPVTSRGTYSWTKSRVIGITPAYRGAEQNLPGNYTPGATFQFAPEHTWAWSVGYTNARTTAMVSLNGISQIYVGQDELYYRIYYPRLSINRPRLNIPVMYQAAMSGYVMADINATRRVSSNAECLIQILNVMDHYQNDVEPSYASMGRQTKVGIRLRR